MSYTVASASVHLSVKDWLSLLLLLTPVTVANNVTLEIQEFSSSKVDLSCEWTSANASGIYFSVRKNGQECLYSATDKCEANNLNKCDVLCGRYKGPNTLQFSVFLDGTCEENSNIRCTVNNITESELHITKEKSLQLTAQSDPPRLSVNNGQPVVASCEHVEVVCIVENICSKTKLDISGPPMENTMTTHTVTGKRFTTITTSKAIFSFGGSYNITCKESGKDYIFSKNLTVFVEPNPAASQDGPPCVNDATSVPLHLIIVVSSIVLILTIGGVVFAIFWRKRRANLKPERDDMEEAKVLLDKLEESRAHLDQERDDLEKTKQSVAQSSNYMEIENLILQLNSVNIIQHTEKILNLLEEGKMDIPTDRKPLIYYLTEKLNDLYHEPSIAELIKKVLEIYEMPDLSKMEDLIEMIWEKFGKRIEKRTEERRCIQKLKILLQFDEQLSTRLLWKFVKNGIDIPDEQKPWNNHADVIRFLITERANPFFLYDETTEKDSQPIKQTSAFTLFLEKYEHAQLLSLIPVCFKEAISRWKQLSVLNDVVRSVPCVINLLDIKEPISQIIEKDPSLRDDVDVDGRTPLHNLMRKIFINGVGWNMPETDGLGNLADLTIMLTTAMNANLCDKDGVTPYSWIMFELISSSNLSRDLLYPQNTKSLTKVEKAFLEKGAKRGRAVKGIKVVAYWKIDKVINEMKSDNKYPFTKFILDILTEWKIIYPQEGHSIISKVIEKTDVLYQGTSFAMLIKALYLSYRGSSFYGEEKLAELIWNQINPFSVDNESKEMECIYKLKIFIHLETDLSNRLLKRCAELQGKDTWNPHFVNVVIFLIKEGANPFEEHNGTSVFILLLAKSGFNEQKLLMTSVLARLEKGKEGDMHKSILNDIVKSTPTSPSIDNFCHISELIFNIIKKDPAQCNDVDNYKRTPLHNFMMKNFVDSAGWNMTEFDSLVNVVDLAKELTTSFNINFLDNDNVTPYTWICLEKKSIQDRRLSKRMAEIEDHFQKNGALKEEALKGIKVVGARKFKSLLQKWIHFDAHIVSSLTESKQKAREFINSLKQEVKIDCCRIRKLKIDSCKEYCEIFLMTTESSEFIKSHIEILNQQILEISQDIMEVFIDECNAQKVYKILTEHADDLRKEGTECLNYSALWDAIKMCLDKGACPTEEDIIKIMELNIFKPLFKTPEALLPMVKMIEQLIKACKDQGNSNPIKIYLNPLQNQYKVKENLRTIAGKVIEAAYRTPLNSFSDKPDSVINTLLFLKKDDSEGTIRKCFEKLDKLLSRAMSDLDVISTKSFEDEESYEITEKSQRKVLIKRNHNWLKRNVLHLAVIFCHDRKVLNCIPEGIVNARIKETDIHGSTPLHIAYLHDNKSAIEFLESHNAKKEVQDYFGRTPKSEENSNISGCTEGVSAESCTFDLLMKVLFLQSEECDHMAKTIEEILNMPSELKNIEVKLGGSVRERLKIGRPDEFDFQMCNYTKQFLMNDSAWRYINEILIKTMTKAQKQNIPLRLINPGNPWKFIWEEEGPYHGLEIKADIELFSDEEIEQTIPNGLKKIIEDAPSRQCLIYLKVDDFGTALYWSKTMCRHEWDILDHLPPGCRMGVLIAKALLEAQKQESKNIYRRVNPQGIKNAMYFLLAGETPMQIEHGNVIKETFGARKKKLQFQKQDPKWMTEEDLEDPKLMEKGRKWAEKVFGAIKMIASKYGGLIGEFLLSESRELHPLEPWQLYDVIETCEICLDQLKQDVFFGKKTA